MLSKSEINQGRREIGPAFVLGVTLIVIILLLVCVVGGLLLRRLNTPSPTATPELSSMPVSFPTTAAPRVNFELHLPMIHSGIDQPITIQSAPATEPNLWKVTQIKQLDYESDGKRFDVAIFTRVDGQETAKGYCIDRGLDAPEIGTEYILDEQGVFIPLDEPIDPTIQRFQRFRK